MEWIVKEGKRGGGIYPSRSYEKIQELVRCKECKYRYMDKDLNVWICTYGLMIKPDGFCNYGERREP